MRVPWSARKSSQFILKEINPEHSSEGLMLKLKFQYFGHLMQRADSLGKLTHLSLMLGKTEGKRRGEQQRMRWSDNITDSMDMNLSKLQEVGKPGLLQSLGLKRVGHNLSTEQQNYEYYYCAYQLTKCD